MGFMVGPGPGCSVMFGPCVNTSGFFVISEKGFSKVISPLVCVCLGLEKVGIEELMVAGKALFCRVSI